MSCTPQPDVAFSNVLHSSLSLRRDVVENVSLLSWGRCVRLKKDGSSRPTEPISML
jgi:hypothetical protein